MTKRYLLDRNGVPVGRLQGRPGKRHFDIAATVLGPLEPGTDFYAMMFAHKYARVAEAGHEMKLSVDAPLPSLAKLTNGQRQFLRNKQAEGWQIVFNSQEFLETRDTPAQQVTKQRLD